MKNLDNNAVIFDLISRKRNRYIPRDKRKLFENYATIKCNNKNNNKKFVAIAIQPRRQIAFVIMVTAFAMLKVGGKKKSTLNVVNRSVWRSHIYGKG